MIVIYQQLHFLVTGYGMLISVLKRNQMDFDGKVSNEIGATGM